MAGDKVTLLVYEEDIINFLDDERRPQENRGQGQRRMESFADVVHRIIIEVQEYRLRGMKVKFDGDRSD